MEGSQIVLKKLSKRYHGVKQYSLRKVSLEVAPGEVYGLLGANGAGKSTTIRTLLNFIQPTEGSATICGLDIVNKSVEVKDHVGYLSGDVALYEKMTGKQFLTYMAQLKPIKQKGYLRELVKQFEADIHKPLGALSKGNRQKIGLIQAFMNQPEVLILDEPTSGLDPLMQEEFFKLVRESKQRGASLLVSSHNLAEVQRMCDRIGFIRDGRLISEQTLADIAKRAAHTLTITFADTAPVAELRHLPKSKLTAHDQHHVTISVEGELTALFMVLAQHRVTQLSQREVNLEEEFLKFYRSKA